MSALGDMIAQLSKDREELSKLRAERKALKEENKRLKTRLEDIREMSEFPGFAIIEDRKAVGSLLDIIHETAKQALLKEE